MALTILSLAFFGLLVLGVPVAFAIGLSAVATILYEGLPLAVVFQRMIAGMNIFSFLAIPFWRISIGEVMKTILPFYAALIAALFAVTYVPAFSLALPRYFLGH